MFNCTREPTGSEALPGIPRGHRGAQGTSRTPSPAIDLPTVSGTVNLSPKRSGHENGGGKSHDGLPAGNQRSMRRPKEGQLWGAGEGHRNWVGSHPRERIEF